MIAIATLALTEAHAGNLTVGTSSYLYGTVDALNQCSHQRINLLSDTRGYGDWHTQEPRLTVPIPETTDAWAQAVGAVRNLVTVLHTELGKHGLPARTAQATIGDQDQSILLRVEATGSPLFPDRCTWENNSGGAERLELGRLWRHCQSATAPDETGEAGMVTPPSDLYGGWVEIPSGASLTLSEYLQQLSNKYDLLWRYQCMDGSEVLEETGPQCVFVMSTPKAPRSNGEAFLDVSRGRSGATGCIHSSP